MIIDKLAINTISTLIKMKVVIIIMLMMTRMALDNDLNKSHISTHGCPLRQTFQISKQVCVLELVPSSRVALRL